MTDFRLDKWYFDCVSADLAVLIGYAAKLKYGPIDISYGARITKTTDGPLSQRQSLSFGRVDEEPDCIRWSNDALRVAGTWIGGRRFESTVLGAFLVVLMAGREHIASVYVLMLAGVVGAAVVGQLLVGSSNGLSRPFGYFGGLLGITFAGLRLYPLDHSMLLVLTAFCFAGPWTQALGRLRCIVQGCCHGAPPEGDRGIVVNNEHSRVCALAGLKGRSIYPTQLYSILGNLAVGVVLVWLWSLGAPLTLIGGLYLALAGLVRFIEEGYRGEPMTKVVGGLHIYQWFAAGMLMAGLLVMMIDSAGAPPLRAPALVPAMGIGLIFFVVCGFAMGVDFPGSQRRFSRLSG